MKLSEFLFNKLEGKAQTPEIEEWIVEWYMSEFTEIGCGKENIRRAPPSWLASWRGE